MQYTTEKKTGNVHITLRRFRASTVAVEISVTHYECVFVALEIQHALRVRHFVICGLLGSAIFFHASH
jgi:hypothetical protein